MTAGYWVGFNRVPHIGPARLALLLQRFGDIERAWQADAPSLRAAGLPENAVTSLLHWRGRIDLDKECARLQEMGLSTITWDDPTYPARLREIDYPPPLLYVRGALSSLDDWAIAIVGTRSSSIYGKEVAQRLASGLARSGITVVSGLALGIDGIAHRAAIDAGGRTLAVLGCGLDTIYPSRHRELAEQVAGSGALLSDYPLDTKPEAGNFPARNRIISGLSLGTLVIEAGERSGALITMHFALEQGREVFAIPGNIYSRTSEGTNRAIKRGEAKLVTCVEDILEELNLFHAVHHQQVREVLPETPSEKVLLGCLGPSPVHIDEIVRQAGLPTAEVSSTLCMMELKGMVHRAENMAYIRAQ